MTVTMTQVHQMFDELNARGISPYVSTVEFHSSENDVHVYFVYKLARQRKPRKIRYSFAEDLFYEVIGNTRSKAAA